MRTRSHAHHTLLFGRSDLVDKRSITYGAISRWRGCPTAKKTRQCNGDRRRTFNPFTRVKLADIDKGVHASTVYNTAALKMLEVFKAKQKELATAVAEGDTASARTGIATCRADLINLSVY